MNCITSRGSSIASTKEYQEMIDSNVIPPKTINIPKAFADTLELGTFTKPVTCRFRSKIMNNIHDHCDVIFKMLVDENKPLVFIARWLKVSVVKLKLNLIKFIKTHNSFHNIPHSCRMKIQRIKIIKEIVIQFIKTHPKRCFTIKHIMDFSNNHQQFNDINPKYFEVRNCLNDTLHYSYRKACHRPIQSLNLKFDDYRERFKQMIEMLTKLNYLIIYVDECQFNSMSFSSYTWMKKNSPSGIVVRNDNKRYNAIAAFYSDKVYFHIKTENTNSMHFCEFLTELHESLQKTISKNQLSKRVIMVFDNAKIHITKEVKDLLKNLKIVAFTTPPYTPEYNKIELIFGILKNKISRRNLANKNLINVIIDEIKQLRFNLKD